MSSNIIRTSKYVLHNIKPSKKTVDRNNKDDSNTPHITHICVCMHTYYVQYKEMKHGVRRVIIEKRVYIEKRRICESSS